MAARKKQALTPKERLETALVPESEWPNEVPDNWCWVYLTSGFAECRDTYRKPVNAKERASRTGKIPYYGATGQVGWIDDYLTDEELVLLGEDGAPFLDRGKDKAYLISGKAWVNNHAHILRSFFGTTGNRYLVHCLNCFNYEGFVSGTTRLKLTQASMAKMPIPLPPTAEQKRIVSHIEWLFSKLDDAETELREVIEQSEHRQAAILHKGFSGDLTRKWRLEHVGQESSSLSKIAAFAGSWKTKDQRLLAAQQADCELVVKGGHAWVYCTIGAIGRVTNGSTPSRKVDDYWDGNIPWVSSGEVRNNIIADTREGITQKGYDSSSVQLLPKGTVLIAMIGEGKTRGQSSILDLPATINQNIAAVVIDHGYVDSRYLWYWFRYNYKRNREAGAGSGPQALNCQRVRELPFVLPEIDEQCEIARIVGALMEREEQICNVAIDAIETINNLRKTLLSKALRGELGTNDPSEPNSKEMLAELLAAI